MMRRTSSRALAIVVVFGLVLAGCGGVDVLLQLGATVDQYFSSGDFGFDLLHAAHIAGKVLGGG